MDIREAVKSAIASVKQEGFVFTEAELAEFEKVADGELTTDEFLQNLFSRVETLKKTNPELFYHPGE